MSILGTAAYYVCYPFLFLFYALFAIASPLLHCAQFILHACWWPFRVLGKFEVS